MLALFSATLFLAAALLFSVEPMVGKFVLPLLGGSPQVWVTSVLFFQVALLAGYAWAHVAGTRLGRRTQIAVQVLVLAAALLVLPLGPPDRLPPAHSAHPVLWLLGLLLITVGPPFFAGAALGPLVQRWLSRSRNPRASDPYVLFAASNAGSLAGLLLYPLVVEPSLSLRDQGRVWSAAFAALLALTAACGVAAWRARAPAPAEEEEEGEEAQPEPEVPPPSWRTRGRWLALSAVPASLMLGTTSYITRDLAPVPLLWVLPLAAYLLTLVISFAPGVDPSRLVRVARLVFPGVAVLVVYTLAAGSQRPLWFLLPLHLLGLLAAALLCHARLAADRPPPARLTEFYLWVALGGALGGVVNAVLAPLILPGLAEYPAALVAALALRPPAPSLRPGLLETLFKDRRPTQAMDVVVPALLGVAVAVALLTERSSATDSFNGRSIVFGLAVGLAVNLVRRPTRFALAMAAILLASLVGGTKGETELARDRSFFGIYRVVSVDGFHRLYDGTTLHGSERLAAPEEATSYYSPPGPFGQAMRALPAATKRTAAIVGLGTGALACYAPPGGAWTFVEIDPVVVRLARDPKLFSYLRLCPPAGVVVGDGRLALRDRAAARYGLIVLDAFSSDAIPVHLVTEQALELYLHRLRPGGALMFNLSNRYVDLEPVLGRLAGALHLGCVAQRQQVSGVVATRRGYATAAWAVLAPDPATLGGLRTDPRWHACRSGPLWTDGYSSVLGIMRWG
jgi:spermidine synthase